MRGLQTSILVVAGAVLLALAFPSDAAFRGPRTRRRSRAADVMPRVTDVIRASKAYPTVTEISTSHRGWRETAGYVNTPQTIRVRCDIHRGGEAVLLGRDEWDAGAPWRELGRWTGEPSEPQRVDNRLPVASPTAVRLQVRGPAWPHSGPASLRLDYIRYTIAALHGSASALRRPVILAPGYDPYNTMDWNDPFWQRELGLATLVQQAREQSDLDTWVLDWGWGAAPMEQQADDFTEIAREIRRWNGGRRATVVVGVSMGAVSLQYALAAAASRHEDLGVSKYVSINGPHEGAWVNSKLLRMAGKGSVKKLASTVTAASEGEQFRRGLFNPAGSEMIIGGPRHDSFYGSLHALGDHGYDPGIPRVAFTGGTLACSRIDDHAIRGRNPNTLVRVLVRPLYLPFWVTVKRIRPDDRYGDYPGELLPADMRLAANDHLRFFSIFRFDYRVDWESIPTLIPTFSSLDFPPDVESTAVGWRYTRWRESRFPQIYVSADGNHTHEDTRIDWLDPRTGRRPSPGDNTVLREIEEAFPTRA